MARQEECAKCKWAKHGGYSGEIKCSYYGRKPQFDASNCPNLAEKDAIKCPECGQAVSPEATTCPNCGYPLKEKEPPKKTAEDIINEHKQKEDDLRDKIIKKYNIEGEISDEQYRQLVAIYMEEEERNNTAPSQSPQRENDKKPEKESSGKAVWIILALVVLLGGGVFGYVKWNDRQKAARQEAETEYNRMVQEQRMEQEQKKVPDYIRFGWDMLKVDFPYVLSCSAYSVQSVSKEKQDGRNVTIYVVIYEVKISSRTVCIIEAICPELKIAHGARIYCDGTMEENRNYIDGTIVKVNLK